MKLEIPIIVGFDDMESLLGDLKKLQTYKLFDGDEMVLVDIEDVAKVLMDHVKAKKSVTTDDLISRKAVCDAIECMRFASDEDRRYGFSLLEQIPTAQPDESKYEYHYDHTDCIWFRPEARNRCPSTCAQYRDGWNDAMNYIFRDGKGYRPYRRDANYGE